MKSFWITTMLYLITIPLIRGQDSLMLQENIPDIQDTIRVDFVEDFELFNSEVPLKMNLVFDMNEFMAEKSDPEYIDAVLNFCCEQDTMKWDVRIKARGEFRRNFCSFPPIMINVKDMDQGPESVRSQKTMKLVTHCHDGNTYQEYVFKEYLIYKLYNILTPYSFRVRLVNINYIDEKDPDDVISSYGFLIENVDQLADRNKAVEFDSSLIQQHDMIPENMTRLAIFQYMIGNVDWQVGTHNVKILTASDPATEKAIPVPYDFDHSGFVNAKYAVPRRNLGLTDIRQRRYMGGCSLNILLPSALNEFAALQEEFVNTVNDFELISGRDRKDLLSYLDEFYNLLLNDRDELIDKMEHQCILTLPLEESD